MFIKNILSLILGFIFASLGGFFIVVIFIPLKMWLVPADLSSDIYSDKELLFYLFLSIFIYIWFGFITAKTARIKKLLVAMMYPFLGTFFWLFSDSDIVFPIWYLISSLLLSFVFTYFGAKLYLNQTLKEQDNG